MKFLLFCFMLFTVYFVAWNSGYDAGYQEKVADKILTNNGTIVCHYVKSKCGDK